MAGFVIRIELHGHGHDSDAYKQLHTVLAAKNVSRAIRSDDGKEYALPIGSYYYIGEYETKAVREWISTIVNALGYNHFAIVTRGDSAWLLQQL